MGWQLLSSFCYRSLEGGCVPCRNPHRLRERLGPRNLGGSWGLGHQIHEGQKVGGGGRRGLGEGLASLCPLP